MRRTSLVLTGVAAVASICLVPALASAATYQVGPGRSLTQLEQLEETLQPGDVVELDGDATYTGDVWLEAFGTASSPVTVRGIIRNGKRPVIAGGDYTLIMKGGHWLLENLDITGGAEVCLFHKADDLVVRDSVVHHCAKHGVLGADLDTGSLLMSRVEVHNSGYDIYKHQVYIATDEQAHPGSVFRMEGCWLHDATGGINVKSRAERVELYGNWIEGAQFHELDLVGSQEFPVDMAREDSDVVGNVFVKSAGNPYTIARVGGDGTGNSRGRHRFANNTMILDAATQYAFRLGGELQSFELHNNVIHGTGATQLWREEYAGTMAVSGTSNWTSQSITMIDGRVGGVRGTDPGFVSLSGGDFRPASGSALVDAATASPAAPSGLAVPNAQAVPAFVPVVPGVEDVRPRTTIGSLDVGAFELGDDGSGSGSGAGGSDTTTSSSSGGQTTGSGAGGSDTTTSSSSGETTGAGGSDTTGSGDSTGSGSNTGDGNGAGSNDDDGGAVDDDDDDDDGTTPFEDATNGDDDSDEVEGDDGDTGNGDLVGMPGCAVGAPLGSSGGLAFAALAALGLAISRRRPAD